MNVCRVETMFGSLVYSMYSIYVGCTESYRVVPLEEFLVQTLLLLRQPVDLEPYGQPVLVLPVHGQSMQQRRLWVSPDQDLSAARRVQERADVLPYVVLTHLAHGARRDQLVLRG